MTQSAQKLGRQIVRGGAWSAARHGVHQLFSLVQVFALARLLGPELVGLLSMATLVINATRVLTETGFDKALIQRADVDTELLDIGWSAMLVRAALLTSLMVLGAGAFAAFFHEPRIVPLLQVLAVGILIEGLISIRVVVFQKELDFRRQFIFQMSGEVIGLVTTLGLAVATHSIWSVVYGQLASAAARVLSSYALDPKRPRFLLQRARVLELMRFGRWVGASTALAFVLGQGDNVFVGKVLGAKPLAYYAWAFQLSNLPGILISQVLGAVLFPAYATVLADRERLADLFRRSLRLTIAIALPASALIAALSELFVRSVLGAQWLPVVPIVFALSGFGFLRALGTSSDALLLAIGVPKTRTKIQAVQLCILAAVIFPLSSRYGVVGVGWAVALYGSLNIYAVAVCLRLCMLSLSALTVPVLQVGIASLAGVAAALPVARALQPHALLPALISASAAGSLAYLVCLIAIDRFTNQGYLVEARLALRALQKRTSVSEPPPTS